ncbi:hypothetical protein MSNKSG1_06833 [Marinobacter santoriniensis NKSG1]|uniref:Eight transmembrane protein EpsH n=1 Tax=Marinobacter santoriniensis NKSG1 TaxID=1288826 RepID=M7CPI4_9GAMM|nr:hypothetical protein MSNKSG1_06833 [Marinobacter santoriniensis NKSG1]
MPFSRPYLMVTGIGLLLFYPTWLRLIERWLAFDQVLAHGLFTALIFIGLLLIHPPRNPVDHPPSTSGQTNWLGGAVFILVVLAWGVLELVRIDTLAFLMLPVGLGSLAWILLGTRPAWRFVPYLFLLSLSLPVWADFVPYLVKLASLVVNQTVHLFGMTVLVEGNSISLPYGRLVIADGCSGIRYFAIAILLGTMVSILNDAKLKDWTLTLATAALLGLLANWVRIIILVIVAYESRMQNDLLTDHETMGWLVFAGFVLPALYFSPVRRRSHSAGGNATISIQRRGIGFALIAILIGPVAVAMANSISHPLPEWTLKDPGFTVAPSESLPINMEYPDRFRHDVWQGSGTWISVAQSIKQHDDEKLVPYFHPPIQSGNWQMEKSLGNGIRIYRNLYSRKQVVVWQWFQLGRYETDSYRKAKLLQIPAMLKGYRRFAVITVQRPCKQLNCAKELKGMSSIKPALKRDKSLKSVEMADRKNRS